MAGVGPNETGCPQASVTVRAGGAAIPRAACQLRAPPRPERRGVGGPEHDHSSGEGADYCAVREHDNLRPTAVRYPRRCEPPSSGRTIIRRGEALLDPVQLSDVGAQVRIGEALKPGLLVAMDDRPKLLENGEPRRRDLDDQAPAVGGIRRTARRRHRLLCGSRARTVHSIRFSSRMPVAADGRRSPELVAFVPEDVPHRPG